MNKVLLTGRLTRDPELRSLASGKTVTQFNVATNAYRANGQEKAEFHSVVTWDRLAEICGTYLCKGLVSTPEDPPSPSLDWPPERDRRRRAEQGFLN